MGKNHWDERKENSFYLIIYIDIVTNGMNDDNDIDDNDSLQYSEKEMIMFYPLESRQTITTRTMI